MRAPFHRPVAMLRPASPPSRQPLQPPPWPQTFKGLPQLLMSFPDSLGAVEIKEGSPAHQWLDSWVHQWQDSRANQWEGSRANQWEGSRANQWEGSRAN